ncbi:hypothetical protein [Variovorax sp. E3]|uniref:hypothetical protein n=1 Tax=Variovorax sp. E3 TaxID=1914993 RepID=UPI0018DD73B5|nr:hypothetical protein [Variovorax sp. E3]
MIDCFDPRILRMEAICTTEGAAKRQARLAMSDSAQAPAIARQRHRCECSALCLQSALFFLCLPPDQSPDDLSEPHAAGALEKHDVARSRPSSCDLQALRYAASFIAAGA